MSIYSGINCPISTVMVLKNNGQAVKTNRHIRIDREFFFDNLLAYLECSQYGDLLDYLNLSVSGLSEAYFSIKDLVSSKKYDFETDKIMRTIDMLEEFTEKWIPEYIK